MRKTPELQEIPQILARGTGRMKERGGAMARREAQRRLREARRKGKGLGSLSPHRGPDEGKPQVTIMA